MSKRKGRGGARSGAGRPKGRAVGDRARSRSVTLRESEWLLLGKLSCDGSPQREAARRLRKTLEEEGC